jgi:hypothetical protein
MRATAGQEMRHQGIHRTRAPWSLTESRLMFEIHSTLAAMEVNKRTGPGVLSLVCTVDRPDC